MTTLLDLGSMEISWLGGGEFELDGGTMFGAVPKILWQKKYPPDDENYIKLLNGPLLVTVEGHNILIDTGLGNKLTAKQKQIFRVYRDWSLVEDLAANDSGGKTWEAESAVFYPCVQTGRIIFTCMTARAT